MSKETADTVKAISSTVSLTIRKMPTEVVGRLSLYCGSHYPPLGYRDVITQALTEYLDRNNAAPYIKVEQ
jgi:hypothetical protein